MQHKMIAESKRINIFCCIAYILKQIASYLIAGNYVYKLSKKTTQEFLRGVTQVRVVQTEV